MDHIIEKEFTLINAMIYLPLIYDKNTKFKARFKGDTDYGHREVELSEMTIGMAGYWGAFVGYGELGKEDLQLHIVRMA